MPDIFEPVIRKLFDIGFGNVIVFFLSSAILYAILRKSKILGESEVINGTVALITAFLVGFWFPVFTGFTLANSMAAFFSQSIAILIFLIVGFLMASIFYPDMTGMLTEQFKRRTILSVMIALAIVLFITSGMISTMWSLATVPKKPGEPAGPSADSLLVAVAVILFIVILLIGSSVARVGGE
jgi:uncharacterized membrane protein